MTQQHNRLFFWFILLLCSTRVFAGDKQEVLLINSYTPNKEWDEQLLDGLLSGLQHEGSNIRLTKEYLDADFWSVAAEKVIVKRYCQRAEERQTDLILVSGEEALYALLMSGDEWIKKIPVIFFNVKHPDWTLIRKFPKVHGITSHPDYLEILKKAHFLFPNRTETICLINNSFQEGEGMRDFLYHWEAYQKEFSDRSLRIYNIEKDSTEYLVSQICNPRNSGNRVVMVPDWSFFISILGKNSKAPFFSPQHRVLKNGVLCVYDADPTAVGRLAGEKAGLILSGHPLNDLSYEVDSRKFYYDYKQLDYFHVDVNRIGKNADVLNQPYLGQYYWVLILLVSVVLFVFIGAIVWLVRARQKEYRRRIHAQTRLLVQNKLVEQRHEYYNVFHSIRDGIMTFDLNLNISFVNHALKEMLQLVEKTPGRNDQINEPLFEIVSEGKDVLYDLLNEVMRTGKGVSIPEQAFLKDLHSETYFPVSGEVVPILAKEHVIGLALSVRNISNEEIQKQFFDMAVAQNAIYPWQYDFSKNQFIFPQAFLSYFGRPEDGGHIMKEDIRALVYADDLPEVYACFEEVLQQKEGSKRINIRLLNVYKEYEWWEFRFSVLKGLSDSLPYSALGVCQNVNRYKTTEIELRIARDKALQADKLKTAFLANMSHEIRTPLNAIVGFSDLLTNKADFSEEEVEQFILTINKNCSLLLALINDILDLSRIESGTMDFLFKPHNLPLLLKNIYDSQRFNMKPGVELRLSVPEGDKRYVISDSVRLQQVINNLINNAAKFTTEGHVLFGYEPDETPGYVCLFVEDSGVGIDANNIRHIFERFYKVDNFTQGAGLGLSICYTIVERLCGKISVTSEPGQGTRFEVRIPENYR